MRCHICNSVLKPEETHYNSKYKEEKYGPYDPCRRCLLAIDGVFDDPLDEHDIDYALAVDEEDTDEDERIE